MPQPKANHEKDRLLQARLKRKSLFPKTFKRPSDPEEAREWLRGVANYLSELPNAGPAFRFVAYAIKKVLRHGDEAKLPHELGLIYPPGRVRTFRERIDDVDTARRVDALLRNKTSWDKIEDRLGKDRRTLERIYHRHSDRFRKEERQARINREIRRFYREDRKPS